MSALIDDYPSGSAAAPRRLFALVLSGLMLLFCHGLAAQTFNGTGVGAIPDSPATGTFGAPLDVSFNVAGATGSLTNISLSMTMTHTWIGDLDVVLAPPGVTPGNAGSFIIYNRVGATTVDAIGDSSNLGGAYVFADSAASNLWTAAAAAGDNDIIPAGSYRTAAAAPSTIPAAATDFTAAFSGLTAGQINGNWTLRFRDRGAADIGVVSAAALTLTMSGGGGSNTLTVTRIGSGTGTVTSTPAGIDCGNTCNFSFSTGTNVSLSAAAAGGSTFVTWGGDCSGSGACSVSMSQARNVSATFNTSGGGGSFSGSWLDLGPGPATNGQVEGITNRLVVGAVNALAPHPTDASILYVATVNGGIWRSNNATAADPTWVRQLDSGASLSTTSIRFDPTDAGNQTLLAGIGRNSSLSGDGGALTGVLRTTNGGATWIPLNGGGVLTGRDIRAVAPRGATLVVAATNGVYRSTNTGAAFTLISGSNGLPVGNPTDLVGDPNNNNLLYTVIFNGTSPGIYRSVDAGASWTKASDSATDTQITNGSRALLAVGQLGNVVLALVGSNGRLAAVILSSNGTSGWTDLGVPTTTEQGGVLFGAHPGGQGSVHLSVAADPTNSNIVYVGGDRQPYFGEGVPGSQSFFPNSSGANDYSGRSFRADASLAPASRWALLTHSGTSNNSSPHADSRAMAFEAGGNLLEGDDGGVYKRTSPRTASGGWVSLIGDLQVTEYHSIAYDGVSDRVIGGAQDNGTTQQVTLGSRTFNAIHTGDGGDTAVDDTSSPILSSRYSSFQFLGGFRRRTYDAANVFQSQTFPALTPINGSPGMTAQFYSPITVNRIAGLRLLFGGNNGVYESLDQGATVNRISTIRINDSSGDALEYGVPGNAAFAYVAAGANVYLRTTEGGALSQINTIASGTVRDVAVDPAQPTRLFALSSSAVWFSNNSGSAYSNVTGNLATFSPGAFRSMIYLPRASGDALLVGTDRGVYAALSSSGFLVWQQVGTGLPNAPVYELTYHAPRDVLIAGMLGRGAWRLNGLTTGGNDVIFADGFD